MRVGFCRVDPGADPDPDTESRSYESPEPFYTDTNEVVNLLPILSDCCLHRYD